MVGIEGFGASAPGERLYQEFKITPDQVAATAKKLLSSGDRTKRRAE
jgi:transketolase